MGLFNDQLSVEQLEGFATGKSFLYNAFVNCAWLAATLLLLTLLLPASAILGILSVVMATSAILFWLTDHHQRRTLQDVRVYVDEKEKLSDRRRQKIKALKDHFIQYDFTQGRKQLVKLNGAYHRYQQALNARLSESELAHARLITLAEQLYLAVLDNLSEACSAVQSISAIDTDYLNQQMANASDSAQRNALAERLALYQEAEARLTVLLTENTAAIDALKDVEQTLKSVNLRPGSPSKGLDDEMQRLDAATQNLSSYKFRDAP